MSIKIDIYPTENNPHSIWELGLKMYEGEGNGYDHLGHVYWDEHSKGLFHSFSDMHVRDETYKGVSEIGKAIAETIIAWALSQSMHHVKVVEVHYQRRFFVYKQDPNTGDWEDERCKIPLYLDGQF